MASKPTYNFKRYLHMSIETISEAYKDFSPGILSMLPLFYVGWSDSILSPSEIKMIHKQMDQLDFLTESDRAYLIKWTDPLEPPTDEIYKSWAKAIKYYAKEIPVEKKHSLAQLGLAMASASTGYKSDEIWNSPKTQKAIAELEHNMGLDNSTSRSLLLPNVEGSIDEPFSPSKLGTIIDGQYKTTKDRMRKLLRDPFFSYKTIRDKDDYRLHILNQLKALADQGLSAYAFPEAYGGTNKKGDHLAVFEMLGYHDISLTIKFGVQFGLFGGAVYGLGTEVHHRKYIEPMIKTDLLGCFAMTETGHGSNVKGLETTATYDKETDQIIINTPHEGAGKEYIGNALHSTMAAVFAQLIVDGENHGVHAVLATLRDSEGNLMPGVRVEDNGYKMGLNGVDNGRIWFDQLAVPRENLLNKFGEINDDGIYASSIADPNKRFFTMLGALVAGRVSVGLAGLNASKVALAIAIKYALKRRQFAPKEGMDETILMDYPSHQRRLLPLLAKNYAYYFAMSDLSDQYAASDGTDMRQIETDAAGLKAVSTWLTTHTIQQCREACGGKGYLAENRFTDLKADTDIFTTFEGDNTVLLQLTAKGLLTKFKKSINSQGFMGIMKFLAGKISLEAQEYQPDFTKNSTSSHLLSPQFIFDSFSYREKKLLVSVSDRMRSYLKKRIDPHKAYLKCQMHMIELATAYVDRLALKSMYNKIQALDKSPERAALEKMYTLFGLCVIEDNKDFFLENDYMDGGMTKAIRRQVTKLCQEVREHAEAYVDAFLIPEELLGARIVLYN